MDDNDLGMKRALRLLVGWRMREIEAGPKEERVRLRAKWASMWGGVEGFPQRTSTEDTSGDAEYVAAIDCRRGMRDSEKPLMRTVIWSDRRVRGSR